MPRFRDLPAGGHRDTGARPGYLPAIVSGPAVSTATTVEPGH